MTVVSLVVRGCTGPSLGPGQDRCDGRCGVFPGLRTSVAEAFWETEKGVHGVCIVPVFAL
jgi:hypothetical protein